MQMSFLVFPTLLKSLQLDLFSLSTCRNSMKFLIPSWNPWISYKISWYTPHFFRCLVPRNRWTARRPLLPPRCHVASRNSIGSQPPRQRSLRWGTDGNETAGSERNWSFCLGDFGRLDFAPPVLSTTFESHCSMICVWCISGVLVVYVYNMSTHQRVPWLLVVGIGAKGGWCVMVVVNPTR